MLEGPHAEPTEPQPKTKMSRDDGQKYDLSRLKLHRGGQYGRRPAPRPDRAELVELNDRNRDKYRACKSVDGTYPSRAVKMIALGESQKPWSSSAKRALEMLDAGVPVPEIQVACALELSAWIAEQASKRLPPAPAKALRKAA